MIAGPSLRVGLLFRAVQLGHWGRQLPVSLLQSGGDNHVIPFRPPTKHFQPPILVRNFHNSDATIVMPKKKSKKVYAVAVGREVGIFDTWPECQARTSGFKGAVFKSFKTEQEAKEYLTEHRREETKKRGLKRSWEEKQTNNPQNIGSNPYASSKRPKPCATQSNDGDRTTQSAAAPPTPASESTRLQIHVHVMFDGGSRGNPGLAGAGAMVVCKQTRIDIAADQPKVEWENRRVTELRHFLGAKDKTNNQAEFQGLCVGLQQAFHDVQRVLNASNGLQHPPSKFDVECLVQGDSQLIIKQMNGEYQVKNAALKPYYKEAQGSLNQLHQNLKPPSKDTPVSVRYKLEHVLREYNARADALANEAMDAQKSWTTVTEDGQLISGEEERGDEDGGEGGR